MLYAREARARTEAFWAALCSQQQLPFADISYDSVVHS